MTMVKDFGFVVGFQLGKQLHSSSRKACQSELDGLVEGHFNIL